MQPLSAPVFQNVVAGRKAIIPAFDRGMSYLGILLECSGTTFDTSHLGEIELKANGKTILKAEASHIQSVNNYYNETPDSAFLYIAFADQEARTIDGELYGALDTSVLNSLSMTVEIAATAVAPELKATVVVAPPKVMTDGTNRKDRFVFRTLLDADHSPASGGTHQLQVPIGTRGGNLIKAIHFFHNATITKVNVKRDGVDMQDDGRTAVIDYLQNRRKRTPQVNHEVFDPVLHNNQSDALPTLRSNGKDLAPWRFDVTTSGADSIKTYTEVYCTLESI